MTRAAVLLTAALLLAACGSEVHVDAYPAEADTDCRAMTGDVPVTVAGLDQLRTDLPVAAAWGDPPVILRCGVEPLPVTTECRLVAEVGWAEETALDGTVFTTVGRRFAVSVEVPDDVEPDPVLEDLADLVTRHDPSEEGCGEL